MEQGGASRVPAEGDRDRGRGWATRARRAVGAARSSRPSAPAGADAPEAISGSSRRSQAKWTISTRPSARRCAPLRRSSGPVGTRKGASAVATWWRPRRPAGRRWRSCRRAAVTGEEATLRSRRSACCSAPSGSRRAAGDVRRPARPRCRARRARSVSSVTAPRRRRLRERVHRTVDGADLVVGDLAAGAVPAGLASRPCACLGRSGPVRSRHPGPAGARRAARPGWRRRRAAPRRRRARRTRQRLGEGGFGGVGAAAAGRPARLHAVIRRRHQRSSPARATRAPRPAPRRGGRGVHGGTEHGADARRWRRWASSLLVDRRCR